MEVFNCVEPQSRGHPGGLGGSLICVTKNQLLACNLDRTPKAVPRHIQLPGVPRRLIYSEYLKRLVVGYEVKEIETGAQCRKLTTRPSIAFVDPDSESATPSSAVGMVTEPSDGTGTSQQPRTPSGASGEKITALLDWQFSQENRVYHMVVVGTTHPYSAKNGRVIYITARQSSTVPGEIDSSVKYAHPYGAPVRAMAAYEPSSLVIAVGKEIILQSLDTSTKRWRMFPAYKIESPAVSVTVREPYIYVLTSRHSLCVLKVDENCLSLYGQDGFDREGFGHVNFDNDSHVVMTSCHGGAIVGITDIELTPQEKLMRPAFAAHMPLSVLRLNRSFKQDKSAASQITYGTTIDGAVYRFTTLGETEWQLLRFIQNLCLADPAICPFSRRRRIALNDLDPPNSSKPESMHVSGDILDRLANRGVSYLENLVTSETIGGRLLPAATPQSVAGGNASGGSPSIGKMRKFNDYSEPVVGNVANRFAAVMLWMENLLRVDL